MLIIIAKRSCPSCTQYQPILSEVATDLGLTVYRIETTKLTSENLKKLGDAYDLKSTPTTLVIN